jgi:dihydrofolate reductase
VITIIAAIGKNRELGKNNCLPWNIPEDTKHFKSYTMGKVLIMGRKTFESIGSKPLPGRKCIVVTTKGVRNQAVCAKDVESALSIEHCYPEIVIIGGAKIYNESMQYANKLVITHIDAEFEADVFFPEIDLTIWKINSTVEGKNEKYNYRFVEYIRNEDSRDPF